MGELYMYYYTSRKLKKKKKGEYTKMVNCHLKKYSTLLVIKEMPSTLPEEGRGAD